METFYCIALNKVEGVGRATLKRILTTAGSARNVFECPDSWRKKLQSGKRFQVEIKLNDSIRRAVEEEMGFMEKHRIRLCHYLDPAYPARLKRCPDAPLMFYYLGNGDFQRSRMLAVVGTRNATTYGTRSLSKILEELSMPPSL